MTDTRLQKWEKPVYLSPMLTGDNHDRLKQVSALSKKVDEENSEEKKAPSIYHFVAACRELIFDIKDGEPIFHCIAYSFDVDRMSIVIQPMFEMLVGRAGSETQIAEEIENTLALAAGLGVPVFPNTSDLAPLLAKHHRKMLVEGFTASDETGKRVRLRLTRSPGERIDDPRYITELKPTEHLSPAELVLIKDSITSELARLSNADRALSNLRLAIDELGQLLNTTKRNEGKLQRCLTDNPSLFGPDYVRVLPKHKLGSEYEMDYALERYSGVVDLVEIEASSLPLFTKRGDPSQFLTHAEQQVIDWLAWIERNSAYARENLPGLMAPIGYVVIGTSNNLSPDLIEKLRWRSAMYRGSLLILTYEDLLVRAKQILRFLEGPAAAQVANKSLQRKHRKRRGAEGTRYP